MENTQLIKKPQIKIDNYKTYLTQCLKDPILLDRLVLDGLDEVMVGEDSARKVVFICAIGGFVENANNTSYNLLVNSESGAGKDHLVSTVMKLFPEEMVCKRTRISPMALTYWHNSLFEPAWTWNGKILYLEDCSNAILNSDVFKVFTSGGSHATIVKDQRAVDIEIKGKPVVIITSASADPEPELIRRFSVVNLTETKEQTKEVMMKWADNSIRGDLKEVNNDYSKSLSLLKSGKVVIPWARKLVSKFPQDHIVMRTNFSRFLDYVKASCILHQYSREKDIEGNYIAVKQDYLIAKECILATSCNNKMIPLTKSQRELIEVMKQFGMNIIGEGENEREIGWSLNELSSKISLYGRTQLYQHLNKLSGYGFIEKSSFRGDYDKKPYVTYYYKIQDELKIPTWQELK